MKVIGKNRKAEQVNPEGRRELSQRRLNPNLAVIKVLPGNRVITHQEASSHGPIEHMSDHDFARIQNFRPRHPNHWIASLENGFSKVSKIDASAKER
ncbi:hypothetical protein [Rhodopirellula sp. SWK7]|uniref:hypothetical protein n=1 Tax=Rhodopirellula sp. SWK7 TaxID=595460 RepID=UPI001181C544